MYIQVVQNSTCTLMEMLQLDWDLETLLNDEILTKTKRRKQIHHYSTLKLQNC